MPSFALRLDINVLSALSWSSRDGPPVGLLVVIPRVDSVLREWLTFKFDILSNLVRDFGAQPFLVSHFFLHIRPR